MVTMEPQYIILCRGGAELRRLSSKMLLYILLAYFFIPTFSYNIDVDNTIIYSFPRNTTGHRLNYFGMSVAIRTRASQFLNSSWYEPTW